MVLLDDGQVPIVTDARPAGVDRRFVAP